MTKKNQPGCPCCGCEYHFDDFNRSSSTDVGGDYTETSGDWSIVDFGGGQGSLLIQNSNAVLTIDVAHPNSLADGVAGFAIYAFNTGDQARFLLDYVDSNNYYFVELTVGSSGTLRIYQRSSGTNTLLRSMDVNAPAAQFLSLYVYWGDECDLEVPYILAYMPDDSFNEEEVLAYADDGVSFSTDAKCLATGTVTSGIYFDQLTLWKHKSPTNESCPCIEPTCSDMGKQITSGTDIQHEITFTNADNTSLEDCLGSQRDGNDCIDIEGITLPNSSSGWSAISTLLIQWTGAPLSVWAYRFEAELSCVNSSTMQFTVSYALEPSGAQVGTPVVLERGDYVIDPDGLFVATIPSVYLCDLVSGDDCSFTVNIQP